MFLETLSLVETVQTLSAMIIGTGLHLQTAAETTVTLPCPAKMLTHVTRHQIQLRPQKIQARCFCFDPPVP